MNRKNFISPKRFFIDLVINLAYVCRTYLNYALSTGVTRTRDEIADVANESPAASEPIPRLMVHWVWAIHLSSLSNYENKYLQSIINQIIIATRTTLISEEIG
ncbi:hypothetical protein TNIN_183161 [Trichonephila inaurata madagascariensis]|uniref:Uncharacterized protein n=1 Tax=Trichonephila inaurata madagascariensis TaxID=2747483 RepID=A0A8X6IDG8_9ARAC|nr:hypothetical protein TNIN_183161 [Trichonephila inaurata madagascariensis]